MGITTGVYDLPHSETIKARDKKDVLKKELEKLKLENRWAISKKSIPYKLRKFPNPTIQKCERNTQTSL